jgi:uncharacterized membrane protein
MASHAIGDRPAGPLRLLEAGVFIVLADPAHIRAGRRYPSELTGTRHGIYAAWFVLRSSGEALMFAFVPVLLTLIDWNWLIICPA